MKKHEKLNSKKRTAENLKDLCPAVIAADMSACRLHGNVSLL